ncbi:hypothetical protein GYMLUDRAFT_58990 [Collybiopsis luxurians FD-317 M1]|uniref:Unplaced genomic scaffold GYMLUscaffold_24, whole genome shotgun sequence n=1 Tax=Collybiopsis luxurians FD-317 M1 TaxID=944289 RepID=A0A0D0CPZ9_9AGAR|nr:hypothetical protein GYMLUDRAFT_58990 [Collybiopsis luxurians FD-317 M1]
MFSLATVTSELRIPDFPRIKLMSAQELAHRVPEIDQSIRHLSNWIPHLPQGTAAHLNFRIAVFIREKEAIFHRLSPISRLYGFPEVLGRIFCFHVFGHEQFRPSPGRGASHGLPPQLVLCQVSPVWASVVRSVPECWTSVKLNILDEYLARNEDFSVVQQWLERSSVPTVGAQSLWLDLTIRSDSQTSSGTLLQQIIPHLHRVRSLNLVVPLAFLLYLASLDSPPLPCLEWVSITSCSDPMWEHLPSGVTEGQCMGILRTSKLFAHATTTKLWALECRSRDAMDKWGVLFDEWFMILTVSNLGRLITSLDLPDILVGDPKSFLIILLRYPILVHFKGSLIPRLLETLRGTPIQEQPRRYSLRLGLFDPAASDCPEPEETLHKRSHDKFEEELPVGTWDAWTDIAHIQNAIRLPTPEPRAGFARLSPNREFINLVVCTDVGAHLRTLKVRRSPFVSASETLYALQTYVITGTTTRVLPALEVFHLECSGTAMGLIFIVIMDAARVVDAVESRWLPIELGTVCRLKEVRLDLVGSDCFGWPPESNVARRLDLMRLGGLDIELNLQDFGEGRVLTTFNGLGACKYETSKKIRKVLVTTIAEVV